MMSRGRGSSPSAQTLGRFGEYLAVLLLILKGYRVRHRNWSGPAGELDLVLQRRGEIVFVEVKTRSTDLYGGAAAAVDRDKQRSLARTAAAYLGRFGLWDRPCRFDVVTVERLQGPPFWRVRHLRNAFEPDLGRRM